MPQEEPPVPIILNEDGSYMTNEQIAEHFYKNHMGPKDIELIKTVPNAEEMGRFHFMTGMWMRNNYGMWREDNPHSKPNVGPNPATGTIDDPMFPDQRSHEVMKLIWKKVNVQ